MDIQIYFQISTLRIWSKHETSSFDFAKVWLKGGENGSKKLETNATFLGLGLTKFA